MPPKLKVLMVEDELSLAMVIKDNLESNGYEVIHAKNGDEGLQFFFKKKPDIVILDVMMPKVNGFRVAKTIRNTDRITPILFLTAKVQVKDVIKGFESGGNDYLRKPFSIAELLIRMKVLLSGSHLLEHTNENEVTHFEIGQYTFDSRKLVLYHSGIAKKLTSREADLLKVFCRNESQLLTKKSILLNIWGDDSFFNSRSLDVFVSKLRKHLREDPAIDIINIRGVGYKLLVD